MIFGVVLINALIGFVQEGKAERALEAIRDMLSPSATVMRDGGEGDAAGEFWSPATSCCSNRVRGPADLRLLKAKNLRIEEAVLTGESLPVEKDIFGGRRAARRANRRWPTPAPWSWAAKERDGGCDR